MTKLPVTRVNAAALYGKMTALPITAFGILWPMSAHSVSYQKPGGPRVVSQSLCIDIGLGRQDGGLYWQVTFTPGRMVAFGKRN